MRLSDKYTVEKGRVYLNGIQALVRLPLDQMRRDHAAGLRTASFISGYEGSPLGGYDMALRAAGRLLDKHDIHFVPGVNEDLAATAIFGSQMHEMFGNSRVEGVLGIWYGKGPGVDRSGDVFRHANLAGVSGNNAALVLAGDDHASKSSTIPHQSDISLYNTGIPILYPGNTQEILDYGLAAIALSRYSGAWTGLKLVTNICDGGGTVEVDPERLRFELPEGYRKANDYRLTIPYSLMMEAETNVARLAASREFAFANRLNVSKGAGPGAWLGIATAGKSYYDLMQALSDLGIGAEELDHFGIRIAKFGMTFPLERRFTAEFAFGLETLLVVEEKRSFLELQIREALFNSPQRPLVIGKEDAAGAPLIPAYGEIDPDTIASVLAPLVLARHDHPPARARVDAIQYQKSQPRRLRTFRAPNFCSGCPHNRSTLLLPGQVAGGGIGCHAMAALLPDSGRGFAFLTQMGGEGLPWVGMSPFVETRHMFQNIGDGTYFHSGQLAVQACVAAGVNITFKLLYNRVVAMTGGQEAEGSLEIPQLTRKLKAEGVVKTVILAEDAGLYRGKRLASNAEVRDRSALESTLAELEKIRGVTVLIYDQQCAAEKRRQRSRGKLEEPVKRLVIHQEVCEGCGDCVRQSNCMSLQPVETPLGQKMRIHQSSCNKDYSCVLGDCPSFVTVRIKPGTGLRRKALPELPALHLAEPGARTCEGTYRIVSPGIGGTGVVTINALLATAALIDGLHVANLDQTGAAQKGGAVVSHLIISRQPVEAAAKVNLGNADLILGFDLLGAGHPENLKCADPSKTVAVINTDITPTSEAIRKRKVLEGPELILELIEERTMRGRNVLVNASRIAEGLFGSHLAVNLFLMGVAWQAGYIPIPAAAIEEAIRLNGVEAERNLQVFHWARKYYDDAAYVESLLPGNSKPKTTGLPDLAAYQNAKYRAEYESFVSAVAGRAPALRDTVARCLYKLMAYKDEYEVARLLTNPAFEASVREQWEHVESVGYNLHPPLLRSLGMNRKLQLGSWFRPALRLLASLRVLRGSPLDVFGYSRHRRLERSLIRWYRDLAEQVLPLADTNPALALEIAALPDEIRGYEKIKEQSIERVKQMAREKLAVLKNEGVPA